MTTVSDKVMCSTSLEVPEENEEDPFSGLEIYNEEKFYNLNINVFADPLESINEDIDYLENEFKFFDDDITEERTSENTNKYHIPLEDTAQPVCQETNCNKQFASRALLKDHIRKVHCAEQKYICEVCGKGFTAEYLLMRHKMVHDMKVIECPVCSKKLSGRTNMSVHLRTHTDSRPHKCDTCGKTFVRKCSLNLHIKFVHNKELKCGKCGERFEKRYLLARHISTAHKA
ncbi:unnamed protein product, partial [Brenthis ino]